MIVVATFYKQYNWAVNILVFSSLIFCLASEFYFRFMIEFY